MTITYQQVTYRDVIEGVSIERDDYGIAMQSLSGHRKEAFINNPFLEDNDKCMLLLARVEGVVCGKRMLMPTKFKVGDKIINGISGSNYYVHPSFRKYGIGGSLITFAMKKSNGFLLSAGCSKDSLKIYKAMNGGIIEFPTMLLPRSLYVKGDINTFRSFAVSVFNIFKNSFSILSSLKAKKHFKNLNKIYSVRSVDKVPKWAGEMILKDGHKYMELHDRDWLQWSLDYNFNDSNSDKENQSFYEVWKSEVPVGFFMITVRMRNNALIASVSEWQSFDESKLSEMDIYCMAMSSCPNNVDYLKVASTNQVVIEQLRKLGFDQKGKANIVFKDLNKRFDDVNDVSLWRVRLGYADYMLS